MNPNSKQTYGYRGTVLIVDLDKLSVERTSLKDDYVQNYLGGRGWAIRYLYDNLEKGIDALGPENILAIGLGPLTGTLAPSSARYTVAAKSP